jgi:hypothetical protein
MSVCLFAWYNSVPTGRIFMKFDTGFSKTCREIQVSLKSDANNDYFTWRPTYTFDLSRSFLLRVGNVSSKFVEKIKTRILYSFFFRKSCRLWDNVEKYCTTGQAINENTAHAHRMLDI